MYMFTVVFVVLSAVLQFFNWIGFFVLFPASVLGTGLLKIASLIASLLKRSAHWTTQIALKIRRFFARFIRTLTLYLKTALQTAATFLTKVRRVLSRTLTHFLRSISAAAGGISRSAIPANWLPALALGTFAGLVAVVTIMVGQRWNQLPTPASAADFNTPAATIIYDVSGVELFSLYQDSYRVPVSLSSLPSVLIEATIEAEDARFYEHRGVDPVGILRAVRNNMQHKPTQGASTITQQLARTTFLDRERSWSRKIDEVLLAFKIEQQFEKHQILELYFNTVPYGSVAVGIEAAAKHYFHKSASELSVKESIFLASLTPAPSIFAKTAQQHPDEYDRVEKLAERLLKQSKLSESEYQQVVADELHFAPRVTYKRAPHAVDLVLAQLSEMYSESELLKKGVIVETNIDLSLQNQLQQLVLSEVLVNGTQYNFSNAAVVVADPQTGAVRAMVGSANYYDPESGQVNAATAPRQLGSAVKIIPYALALESGFTPDSTIVDEATTFQGYPNYNPRNYDGRFHGVVTLQEALANSYNIPALKMSDELGSEAVAQQGVKMGLEEYNKLGETAPLSVAIGGVETTLQNLTQAYQVVANDGRKLPLHLIKRVSDHSGKKIYQHQPISEQVISKSTADQLTVMLSDPQSRAAMFGFPPFFDFGQQSVAIKTGTSNDMRDNVAVAFSDTFVVSVWTGNNSSEPMADIASGFTGAAPIMHQAAQLVMRDGSQQLVRSY